MTMPASLSNKGVKPKILLNICMGTQQLDWRLSKTASTGCQTAGQVCVHIRLFRAARGQL